MNLKKTLVGAVCCSLMTVTAVAKLPPRELPTRLNQVEELKWQKIAPSVWKTVIGKPEKINYMTLRRRKEQSKALDLLPKDEFPFDLTKVAGANKAFIRLPFADGEKFYGLGLQFKGIRRDHKRYRMEMSWYHGGNEKTHAPIPFFISNKGYGVLINSINNVEFFFNTTYRPDSDKLPMKRDRTTDRKWTHKAQGRYIEAAVNGNGLEVIIFTGPSLMNVVQRYNLYSGASQVGTWFLGQSSYSSFSRIYN